jgi:hypothetical protein
MLTSNHPADFSRDTVTVQVPLRSVRVPKGARYHVMPHWTETTADGRWMDIRFVATLGAAPELVAVQVRDAQCQWVVATPAEHEEVTRLVADVLAEIRHLHATGELLAGSRRLEGPVAAPWITADTLKSKLPAWAAQEPRTAP